MESTTKTRSSTGNEIASSISVCLSICFSCAVSNYIDGHIASPFVISDNRSGLRHQVCRAEIPRRPDFGRPGERHRLPCNHEAHELRLRGVARGQSVGLMAVAAWRDRADPGDSRLRVRDVGVGSWL